MILVLIIYFSGILWQGHGSRHWNFKGSTKHCESCEAGSRGTGWRETRASLRFLRKFSRLKGEFCLTFPSDKRHNTAVGVTVIPGCHVSFKITALAACISRRSTASCFLGSREQLLGKQRAAFLGSRERGQPPGSVWAAGGAGEPAEPSSSSPCPAAGFSPCHFPGMLREGRSVPRALSCALGSARGTGENDRTRPSSGSPEYYMALCPQNQLGDPARGPSDPLFA